MKYLALSSLALCPLLLAAPVQAEDILSILARKADTPTRLAPKTINYVYTLTIDVTNREGKDVSEAQAVLRIDPAQPAGTRARIISASDPESEALKDFLEEIEDPDNTIEKQASGFWCGADSESETKKSSTFASDLSALTVISDTETEAVVRPDMKKLAALLMQSDENADKNGRKMMKKLMERIEGDVTLAKPSGEMKGFSVRMTRPLTMMIVAKLKTMTADQTCTLAPNGHYRLETMKLHVDGKAMGSRFGQDLNMRISDLTPRP